MKNNVKMLVVGALLSVSTMTLADGEEPQATLWGVKELKLAADSALEKFKADKGEDAFNAVVGYGVDRSIQGTAGKAKVIYKKEGEKVTVSYFCHYHEADEIDCH